jgi:signal transduction histidine kinase
LNNCLKAKSTNIQYRYLMKNIFGQIVNLGVHDDLPAYQQIKIRFTNTLAISFIFLSLFYFIIGLIAGTFYLSWICSGLLIFGAVGLWLNSLHEYSWAQSFFLVSFSILLFCGCNVLSNGKDFAVLYLPHIIAYGVYYDLDGKHKIALTNLSFTCISITLFFLVPHQYLGAEKVPESWVPFFWNCNLIVSISCAAMYIFFIVQYTNKSSDELKRAWREAERQRQVVFEEKNRAEAATLAKSYFLSHMSHELRTPLNGIIGTVHLLLQEDMLTEQKQHFRVLKYSSEHMLSLVNDVLDFSKIEAGEMHVSPVTFNLSRSIRKLQSVFEVQFRERNLELVFDIDPFVDRDFTVDETRLNQVLTNLISNALKFTKRGKVQCTVKLLSATSQSAEIRFEVKDTGIGISADKHQTIFEAFHQGEASTTRRFGGTGLGLSISKKIVTLLGGDLKVDSEVGHGSCFYFTTTLPFSQHKQNFVNTERVSVLKNLSGIRVLMADDSLVNRRIARRFLEKWQIEMDEASDGKEAIQLFFKNKYDFLLIDLHMPGMDGHETIEAIRKVDTKTPAIAFTAAVLPDMRKRLLSEGFTDLLQKPFRPEDLHQKIVRYCSDTINN